MRFDYIITRGFWLGMILEVRMNVLRFVNWP